MNHLFLEVLQGKSVAGWLRHAGNAESWDQLYRACPWSTLFLSRGFFELWIKHYDQVWNPVLILAKDSEGTLRALMPLCARNGLITGAGAHQAEYQGWLGERRQIAAFLKAALQRISETFQGYHVRFRYLPPKMPSAAILSLCKQMPKMVATAHLRPLLKLDPNLVENKLRKKSNRSRLNRLKLAGNLVFVRVRKPDAFDACLDQLIPMYDFRQGAVNDSQPFRDDPRKEAFFRDWFRYLPEQLHVTCMQLDGRLIGAHIGANSMTETHLAILAHLPQYARQSPGKLNLYQSAEALAAEGKQWLDLTPGGDAWKERFATHHDQVMELDVYTRERDARLTVFQRSAGKALRTLLIRLNIAPSRIKSLLNKIRHAVHAVRQTRLEQLLPRRTECRIYRLELHGFDAPRDMDVAHVDALQDLLRFEPDEHGKTKQRFLSRALSRLESGETAYTVVEGQRLTYLGWVAEGQEAIFIPEVGQPFYYASSEAVLYDFSSTSRTEIHGCLEKLIQQMLSDLGRRKTSQVAYIPVLADNDSLLRIVEKLGFELSGTLSRYRFLWYERHWQEPTPLTH